MSLTHEQQRVLTVGQNALREWVSDYRDITPDDWRLIEGLCMSLIASAAGCNGSWINYAKIAQITAVAIYNIGVARGKQG